MPNRSIAGIRSFPATLITALFTLTLTAAPGWGFSRLSDNRTITLDVTNEPLQSVFETIHQKTAWKIKAPAKWMDKPVTQTLHEVKLEDGLRFVLNSAGIENLLLLYDENTMLVTVFDTELSQKQSSGGPSAQGYALPPVVSTIDTSDDPIPKRVLQNARPGLSRGAGSSRAKRRQASASEE